MIQNTMIPLSMTSPATLPAAISPATKAETPAEVTKAFNHFLANALQQVDAQEKQVHDMGDKFILGEVDVDQLQIASERALLSLQLTTQIRNKVIEAYQDIMRMQM